MEEELKYHLDDDVPAGEKFDVRVFSSWFSLWPPPWSLWWSVTPWGFPSRRWRPCQRTFVLCGVMTVLQVRFGHRFPIQDRSGRTLVGPVPAHGFRGSVLGHVAALLRTSLEMGMLLGGALVMALAVSGLILTGKALHPSSTAC